MYGSFDFIKCDIWALALLTWETLVGGSRYFDDPEIQALIEKKKIESSQTGLMDRVESGAERESSVRPGRDIFMIAGQLCQMAMHRVQLELSKTSDVNRMSKAMVTAIFRLSLQVDQTKRCGDVSRLPFTYINHKYYCRV